ncbi:hypothetical protein V1264_019431 [Littorina saxatilis]
MENQNTHTFWNCKPSKPVTCTLGVFPTQDQCDTLQAARTTLATAMQHLSQEQQLASEYFVMNKLLYTKQGQLRRENSLQGLKQIRLCLKRLFACGLEIKIKDFHSDFDSAIIQEGIRVYLPSRQMWEYLLTHFLGTAALLTNTASRCAGVFLHVHRHLASGHLIPTNMVFLSMLSRIWACCQALCLELQTWYLDLIPVKDVLASTNFPWLPAAESLPDDLSSWLSEQGLDAGLATFERVAGSDDLAALMEIYQQGKGSDDEDESTDALDQTLPVSMDDTLQEAGEAHVGSDEDFGDPVRVSDVDVDSGEEGQESGNTCVPGEPKKESASTALPGLKTKVLKAPTIRDLQLILRKLCKKFPENATKKKQEKFAAALGRLETRSLTAERKGRQEQAQKLLIQARKKVFKFIKMFSPQAKKLNVDQTAVLVTGKKKKKRRKMIAQSEAADTSVQTPKPKGKLLQSNTSTDFTSTDSGNPLAPTKRKRKKASTPEDGAGPAGQKKKRKSVNNIDNSPNSGGAGPVGQKKKRKSVNNIDNSPNSGGAGPAGQKKKRKSVNNSDNSPNSGGAGPVGQKKKRKSVNNIDNSPNSGGAGPVGQKKKRKSVNNIDNSPNSGGAGPAGQKKKRKSVNSIDNSPNSGGAANRKRTKTASVENIQTVTGDGKKCYASVTRNSRHSGVRPTNIKGEQGVVSVESVDIPATGDGIKTKKRKFVSETDEKSVPAKRKKKVNQKLADSSETVDVLQRKGAQKKKSGSGKAKGKKNLEKEWISKQKMLISNKKNMKKKRKNTH